MLQTYEHMTHVAATATATALAVRHPVENQVHVTELHQAIRERKQRQVEVYAVVLDRCYRRIRRCAAVNRFDCIFDVPEIIVGKPLFNINACIRYVMNNLVGNGFEVAYYFPRFLHISWDLGHGGGGGGRAAPAPPFGHAPAAAAPAPPQPPLQPPLPPVMGRFGIATSRLDDAYAVPGMSYSALPVPPVPQGHGPPPAVATRPGTAAAAGRSRGKGRNNKPAAFVKSISDFKPSGKFVLTV